MTPTETLREIEAEQARRARTSFRRFIPISWPHVEPTEYVPGWHIDAVAEHMQAVADGEIRRLIINLPPRHTKSLPVSVLYPAWRWITDPSRRFMTASSSMDLAGDFSGRSRDLLESEWFKEHYPEVRLRPDENARRAYSTTQKGYRRAISSETRVTGRGADEILVDDPLDAKQAMSETVRDGVNEWYTNSLRNRLNSQRSGAIVIVMQRLHERDLTGWLLANEPSKWDLLCLPAFYEPRHPTPVRSSIGFRDPRREEGEILFPQRFGRDDLAELAAPGTYLEAGQLQQRPSPREGGFFDRAKLEAAVIDEIPAVRRWVRRWDLAASAEEGDYTAGLLVGERADGAGIVIANVVRAQKGSGAVRAMIRSTAEVDAQSYGRVELVFPQDPGQAGKDQKNSLAEEFSEFSPRFERETGDKVTRAEPLSAQVDAGRVFILRGAWNDALIEEMATFPRGQHDDQVDAAAGAYNRLMSKGGGLSVLLTSDHLED